MFWNFGNIIEFNLQFNYFLILQNLTCPESVLETLLEQTTSGRPSYDTQPLTWHQKQNRPKRSKKVHKVQKKNVSNRVDFGFTLRIRRESVSPLCGIFGWFPSDFCQIFVMSIQGLYFLVESRKTFCGHSRLYKPSFKLLSWNSREAEFLDISLIVTLYHTYELDNMLDIIFVFQNDCYFKIKFSYTYCI